MAHLNNIHQWRKSVRTPDISTRQSPLNIVAEVQSQNVKRATKIELERIQNEGNRSRAKADRLSQLGDVIKTAGKSIGNVLAIHQSGLRDEWNELQRAKAAEEEQARKRQIEAAAIARAKEQRDRERARELANRYQMEATIAYYGETNTEGDITPGIQALNFKPADAEGNGGVSRQKSYIEFEQSWRDTNLAEESSAVIEYFGEMTAKFNAHKIDDASSRDNIDHENYKASNHSATISNAVADAFVSNPAWYNNQASQQKVDVELDGIALQAIYELARTNQIIFAGDYGGAIEDGLEDLSFMFDWQKSTFDAPVLKTTEEAQNKYSELQKEFRATQYAAMALQGLEQSIHSDDDSQFDMWVRICTDSKNEYGFSQAQKEALQTAAEKAAPLRQAYLKERTKQDGIVVQGMIVGELIKFQATDNKTQTTDNALSMVTSLLESEEFTTLSGRMDERTKDYEDGLQIMANFLAGAVVCENIESVNNSYLVDVLDYDDYDNHRKAINESLHANRIRLDGIINQISDPNNPLHILAPYWEEALKVSQVQYNEDPTQVMKNLEMKCNNYSYKDATGATIHVNPNLLHLEIERYFNLGVINADDRTKLLRIVAEKKPKLTKEEIAEIDNFIVSTFNITESKYKNYCAILDENSGVSIATYKDYFDEDDLDDYWETDYMRQDGKDKLNLTTEVILAFRIAACEYAKSQDLHKRYSTITEYLNHLCVTNSEFIRLYNHERVTYLGEIIERNRELSIGTYGTNSEDIVFGGIEDEAHKKATQK